MLEQIKTAVLWLLILLSIFLAYQISTFQPEYAILKSTEYIENTQIGEGKSLQEVIKPKQIIIHHEGSAFSPINQLEFNDILYEELFQGMTFEQFSISTIIKNSDDRKSIIQLEYNFPNSIPTESFKEIYQINSKEQFGINEVDQVVFSLIEEGEKEQILATIISFKQRLVIDAVTNLSVSRFKEAAIDTHTESFYQVFPYEIVNYGDGFKKVVFLPEEAQEVNSLTYIAKPIPPEHFKQSLFSDPSFVKHYLQSNGEESFTDGSRMVNVLNSGNVLSYINPSFGDIVDQSSVPIIISALDFLNGHGGITNPFYFDSIKSVAANEEITFRLVIDGFPIYRSNFYGVNNLFEITLNRVGGNQIEQYIRPLFYIEAEPISKIKATKLPSGHEIVDILKNKPDFDPYLLTDINKGFMMIKMQSVVIFEPSWFIQYNGSWEELSFKAETDDSEVIIGGLE